MNRFLIVLADKPTPDLDSICNTVQVGLRQFSPRIVAILPHMILFQAEAGLREVGNTLLGIVPGGHVNWLLVEAVGWFEGKMLHGRYEELHQFFHPEA